MPHTVHQPVRAWTAEKARMGTSICRWAHAVIDAVKSDARHGNDGLRCQTPLHLGVGRVTGHVALSSARTATLEGQRLMVLRFEEAGTPTVVRTASGSDTAGRGRIWVEPATGDVVRSEVILGDVRSSATTTVDFVRHPRIAVRIPGRMEETYRTPSEYGVGTATYTDVRTFGVTTSEQIKKPPLD